MHPATMTRRVLRVYRAGGGEGLDWYRTANRWCDEVATRHNLLLPTVCGVVAALSPRLGWEMNKRLAVAAVEGKPVGALGGNVRKAEAILAGADPLDVLGGFKVRSFFQALLEPDNPDTVVIDRHAVGIVLGRPATEKEMKPLDYRKGYERFSEPYRRAAAREGVLPNDVQASTWVTWRKMLRGLHQDADSHILVSKSGVAA